MRDKGQQEIPEYHVVAAIRRLRTDKNCHAEKSWPNHVKNKLHIGQPKHDSLHIKVREEKERQAAKKCGVEGGGGAGGGKVTPATKTPIGQEPITCIGSFPADKC